MRSRSLDLTEHLEHFQRRVLQDALTEATAAYWLRRARDFDAARPQRGEFHGQADHAELDARDARAAATALACRRRASISLGAEADPDLAAEIANVLREVA